MENPPFVVHFHWNIPDENDLHMFDLLHVILLEGIIFLTQRQVDYHLIVGWDSAISLLVAVPLCHGRAKFPKQNRPVQSLYLHILAKGRRCTNTTIYINELYTTILYIYIIHNNIHMISYIFLSYKKIIYDIIVVSYESNCSFRLGLAASSWFATPARNPEPSATGRGVTALMEGQKITY